jgi:hypothetical protein
MITVGYKKPGLSRGGVFTVPDSCWGKFSEEEASVIADRLRQATGKEPAWQTIRGKVIQLAKEK